MWGYGRACQSVVNNVGVSTVVQKNENKSCYDKMEYSRGENVLCIWESSVLRPALLVFVVNIELLPQWLQVGVVPHLGGIHTTITRAYPSFPSFLSSSGEVMIKERR